MFDITLITMGKLKEKFYISAAEEYKKRLSGYCRFTLLELPEVRLPEDPSPAEISAGLEKEADLIFSKIPKGAFVVFFTEQLYIPLGLFFAFVRIPGQIFRNVRPARIFIHIGGVAVFYLSQHKPFGVYLRNV